MITVSDRIQGSFSFRLWEIAPVEPKPSVEARLRRPARWSKAPSGCPPARSSLFSPALANDKAFISLLYLLLPELQRASAIVFTAPKLFSCWRRRSKAPSGRWFPAILIAFPNLLPSVAYQPSRPKPVPIRGMANGPPPGRVGIMGDHSGQCSQRAYKSPPSSSIPLSFLHSHSRSFAKVISNLPLRYTTFV